MDSSNTDNMKQQSEASRVWNNAFCFQLLDAINCAHNGSGEASNKTNVLISPMAITIAFFPILFRSSERVRAHILGAIGLESYDEFMRLMTSIFRHNGENSSLSLNACIWADSVRDLYMAHAFNDELPFELMDTSAHDVVWLQEKLNQWVTCCTHNRVPELKLRSPHKPRVMITSAIHFMDLWKTQFDPEETSLAPFHLLDGSTVDVPMMSAAVQGLVEDREHYQCISMRMENETNRVRFITPKLSSENNGDYTSAFNRLVTFAVSNDWNLDGRPKKSVQWGWVSIRLPKCTLKSSFDVRDHLESLGLSLLYQPGCLEHITGNTNDCIESITHSVYYDQNERGVEAAAVAAIIIPKCRLKVVTLDRPFLVIVDSGDRTGKSGPCMPPLFIAQVVNPLIVE